MNCWLSEANTSGVSFACHSFFIVINREQVYTHYTQAGEITPRSGKPRIDFPLEWFRHGAIVIANESQDLITQIIKRSEMASLEQFTHENAEPNFHLIHLAGCTCPGCNGTPPDARGRLKRRGSAYHQVQDPAFALDSQVFRGDPFPVSDPTDQEPRTDEYSSCPEQYATSSREDRLRSNVADEPIHPLPCGSFPRKVQ